VVFLFGIIEFSIMFYDKAVITNACREAARAGIVWGDPRPQFQEIRSVFYGYLDANPDGTDPKRVISFASDDLDDPEIKSCSDPTDPTSCTIPSGCVDSGDQLIVTVSYTYNYLIVPDILGAFFVDNVFTDRATTIVARTNMRCE
jgi:Flp pilus assembly protein TadG